MGFSLVPIHWIFIDLSYENAMKILVSLVQPNELNISQDGHISFFYGQNF